MKLYENIKNRRRELGYTQQQIADWLGYDNRSTVAKIEAGKSDIPVSKISEFARVLMVSEAWLMGWECPDGYSELDPTDKAEIKGEIKGLLKGEKYQKEEELLG